MMQRAYHTQSRLLTLNPSQPLTFSLSSEHIPVTTAAPGLFALPALVLALYRAISPCYYANDPSGNM